MTRVHQTDFSAEQPEAQTAPRVPFAHGDQERPEDPGLAAAPRAASVSAPKRSSGQPAPADRNPPPLAVERLRVRREFLYVAEGYSERSEACRRPGPPTRPAAADRRRRLHHNQEDRRFRRPEPGPPPPARGRPASFCRYLGVAGADYVFIARQDTGDGPVAAFA